MLQIGIFKLDRNTSKICISHVSTCTRQTFHWLLHDMCTNFRLIRRTKTHMKRVYIETWNTGCVFNFSSHTFTYWHLPYCTKWHSTRVKLTCVIRYKIRCDRCPNWHLSHSRKLLVSRVTLYKTSGEKCPRVQNFLWHVSKWPRFILYKTLLQHSSMLLPVTVSQKFLRHVSYFSQQNCWWNVSKWPRAILYKSSHDTCPLGHVSHFPKVCSDTCPISHVCDCAIFDTCPYWQVSPSTTFLVTSAALWLCTIWKGFLGCTGADLFWYYPGTMY